MEDLGPLVTFIPLGAVASAIVATARRWKPAIDGWWVVLALVLVSGSLVTIGQAQAIDAGTLKTSKLLLDVLGTSFVAFIGFNGIRAATNNGSAGSGQP